MGFGARLAAWFFGRSPRERRLLMLGVGCAAVVLVGTAVVAVHDDLTGARARLRAKERELEHVRHLAGLLDGQSGTPTDETPLLSRMQSVADSIVGREQIASMAPSSGSPSAEGVVEERVAVRIVGISLPDLVRLLYAIEGESVALDRTELRKHTDEPGRFDLALDVVEVRSSR